MSVPSAGGGNSAAPRKKGAQGGGRRARSAPSKPGRRAPARQPKRPAKPGTTDPSKPKRTRGRAIPLDQRRRMVAEIMRMEGIANSTRIMDIIKERTGVGIKRDTVADDIRVINAETQYWVNEMSGGAFMRQARHRYIQNNEQADKLVKLIDDLLAAEGTATGRVAELISKAEELGDADLIKELTALVGSVQKTKIAGKVAYLSSILVSHWDFELTLVSGVPLLSKMRDFSTAPVVEAMPAVGGPGA